MFRIGATPDQDRYRRERAQFDAAISQQITPRLRAFVELTNLTNESYLTYTGSIDRPIETEFEGRWGMLGMRFDF